ncbi:hypothetical protein OG226_30565 [Streptomyces sp. NBC_01261]|nr:hypothetical protein [Streptomyces sp. NBC_01261]
MLERGRAGDILVADLVAHGAEPGGGGADVPRRPPAVGVIGRVDDGEQAQRVSAIRPYSTNACPSGVSYPSRPNIRNRSYALLPEPGDRKEAEAADMTSVLVGALWTRNHPAPGTRHPAEAARTAYAYAPSLAFLRTPFAAALERSIASYLIGLLTASDH